MEERHRDVRDRLAGARVTDGAVDGALVRLQDGVDVGHGRAAHGDGEVRRHGRRLPLPLPDGRLGPVALYPVPPLRPVVLAVGPHARAPEEHRVGAGIAGVVGAVVVPVACGIADGVVAVRARVCVFGDEPGVVDSAGHGVAIHDHVHVLDRTARGVGDVAGDGEGGSVRGGDPRPDRRGSQPGKHQCGAEQQTCALADHREPPSPGPALTGPSRPCRQRGSERESPA